MPQRAASKVECPQELRQAVDLIVMFAIRKGGDLALEGRQPGGAFLGGYTCPASILARYQAHNLKVAGSNPAPATNYNKVLAIIGWSLVFYQVANR